MSANTTKKIEAAEDESPILYRSYLWFSYCRQSRYGANEWACINRLSDLFDLEDAERLVFVAKSKPDRSTYKVVLGEYGDIVKPISVVTHTCLSRWLKKQIAAGRPHIGVRIIK